MRAVAWSSWACREAGVGCSAPRGGLLAGWDEAEACRAACTSSSSSTRRAPISLFASPRSSDSCWAADRSRPAFSSRCSRLSSRRRRSARLSNRNPSRTCSPCPTALSPSPNLASWPTLPARLARRLKSSSPSPCPPLLPPPRAWVSTCCADTASDKALLAAVPALPCRSPDPMPLAPAVEATAAALKSRAWGGIPGSWLGPASVAAALLGEEPDALLPLCAPCVATARCDADV
ncbi:hypothetical protein V8C86DRAFT_2801452 [Haematococcus lacustris]